MIRFINVADIVNPASGKTYRQENSEKQHNITLGSIVEVLDYDSDSEQWVRTHDSLRLFVVKRGRDCDQTPLYWLSASTVSEFNRGTKLMERAVVQIDGQGWKGELFGPKAEGGYPEESLLAIRGPKPEELEGVS